MSQRGSEPLVKICGVTRPRDARLAVELGASLLGLNFYEKSPRCLDLDTACRVADAVRGRCPLVGVFVNKPAEEIEEIRSEVGLDLLQLHGDEGDEEVRAWGARAIKVFRVEGEPEADGPSRFPEAWGFLFDVKHEAYGGTGKTWNYRALAAVASSAPVLVAGGIGAANARQALEASGAAGIDVCSGVESAPGIKDPKLMERLFVEVHRG